MKKGSIILSLVMILYVINGIYAQDYNDFKPGDSRFMIRGYGHAGLESIGDNLSFVGGSFNPIFLWQQNDRLIFESELGLSIVGEETELELEYANISYLVNKYMTLRLGKFLLPFGIFSERLHPAWINKLSTTPLGLGHHDPVGPTADYGVEIRGAFPIQDRRLAYSVYVTNGPTLNNGMEEPEESGSLHYTQVTDNNRNKAIGGRLGLFPFSDSSLEIGLSAQIARVGTEESDLSDIWGRFSAVDFTLIRSIPKLKSVFDVRGQLNNVSVDDAEYVNITNGHDGSQSFENQSTAYFGQFSIRPAYVDIPVLKQLEFVGRYSGAQMGEGAPWENNSTQTTIGVNYWLDWRSVLKFSYQINNTESSEEGEHGENIVEDHDANASNGFYIHWAIGF